MAQISLRVEDEVKKMAEQACADIGMSLSTARFYSTADWESFNTLYLQISFFEFDKLKFVERTSIYLQIALCVIFHIIFPI